MQAWKNLIYKEFHDCQQFFLKTFQGSCISKASFFLHT